MAITVEDIKNTRGHFTWSFIGPKYFVETPYGNFIWSDPQYPDGDNMLVRYKKPFTDWIRELKIPYGRDKGSHVIREYCGDDVKVTL